MNSSKALPAEIYKSLESQLLEVKNLDEFSNFFRLCAKIQSQVLLAQYIQRQGTEVQNGPFRGMKYINQAAEGGYIPRAIGCYERSLRPIIEEVIKSDYQVVMDVGSAEGYYAVGLAQRMPSTRIIAYDISETATALCQKLAESNGVSAQIENREQCTFEDFEICSTHKTFVLCDIEGAERELLDIEKAPALAKADILVETHPFRAPKVLETLKARFSATHEVVQINREVSDDELPEWANRLGDLDRLLMLWEWRYRPTPWLWMKHK